MKTIVNIITEEIQKGFEAAGYEAKYGIVTLSNRPDLCQYQCNGALAAAKQYRKAPIEIAEDVVELLKDKKIFKEITALPPGFININLSEEFLADFLNDMDNSEDFGSKKEEKPRTISIDYGGPNIAKPLHVGHMRSAIIGESIKRILRFKGNKVIGDVHLGDWGTQMGLVIAELKRRKGDLVYFDDQYTGDYPSEAPFTISELEEIYPTASEYSKENPEFLEEAKEITYKLQQGHGGYNAIWNHILDVSITDLKRIYEDLNVSFDLWKKESDALPYIDDMVEYFKENNYTRLSDGALVIDVKEDTDTKEIPPCLVLKSDGAALYQTTDLATIIERMELYDPDQIIYVTDKRQELHFEQVFRAARKTKLVKEDTILDHVGYGTMNGKDGKPFKTREGGVMRLEYLIDNVVDEVYNKMKENPSMGKDEAKDVADKVGVAALKYGDLSNQISKDYVFDLERFTSFEGNTGPYILYTIVRIKSILEKQEEGQDIEGKEQKILPAYSDNEVDLMLELARFNEMISQAYEEMAPHRICHYIYELANAFNSFYHNNKILTEKDEEKRASWIALITLVKNILLICVDLLGIEAPDRM